MRKAKPSVGRQASQQRLPRRTLGPVDLKSLREEIRDIVSSRALAMVETTIEEVDKGHYLAMKYLFEMIGLFPETPPVPESAPEEESLARTLLRRLQIPEEQPMPEVTSDTSTPEAEGIDPVK